MNKVFNDQLRVVALEYATRVDHDQMGTTSILRDADSIYEWLTYGTGTTQRDSGGPQALPAEALVPDTAACSA